MAMASNRPNADFLAVGVGVDHVDPQVAAEWPSSCRSAFAMWFASRAIGSDSL